MCGIVGILNLTSTSPVNEALLVAMRDEMIHRGPDGAGTWISPDQRIGLGHRRLSIMDLSAAGAQPMTNEDGNLWITFNGEIYNHPQLRPELEKLGHKYRSNSDTETILHAYEEWGAAALERIDGMFAFAIWDQKKRQLWLVRDRLGKKPLYFTEAGGQFLFASEIKALLVHPSARRAVSEEALWHYLSFAVAPAPYTLFDGIYKLPPATHLTIEQGGKWTFKEYWRPWAATDEPGRSAESYAEDIRNHLQNAVDRRLMSDVPFGVFLSGGVDSSVNVALMSRTMNRPVDTFSVGFADQAQAPYNEIQYARQVAALFKTNHHEVLINDQHFLDLVDSLARMQDEPLSDPVCFPLYYVTQLARKNGTIVIQVGEGSDEIFAGYDIYRNYLRRQKLYWRRFQLLPRFMRRSAAWIGSPFLNPRFAVHLQRAAEGEPVFVSAALAFYDDEKADLRSWQEDASSSAIAASAYTGRNPSMDALSKIFPGAMVEALPVPGDFAESDFLKKIIHWEIHQRLGELLLMRLDKMMMANSVEGRAPFLDTKLVELAMRIPSSLKIQNGVGKAILKKAVEPLLPHELIYRKKVGFCGGSGNMLTPGILKYAEQTILSTLPLYDWPHDPLHRMLQEQETGMGDHSFQIWNLLNLALWYRRWF